MCIRDSRYCRQDPALFILGSTGFPPILLGLNTVADHVTGSIDLFSEVDVTASYQDDSLVTPVYVAWYAETYSGVVPEADAWLQITAGLALLVACVRRNPRPSH